MHVHFRFLFHFTVITFLLLTLDTQSESDLCPEGTPSASLDDTPKSV